MSGAEERPGTINAAAGFYAFLSAVVFGWGAPVVAGRLMTLATDAWPFPGSAELCLALRDLRPALSLWCFVGWLALFIIGERNDRAHRDRMTDVTRSAVRYGPVATLGMFLVLLLPMDVAATEYSKWQLARYVHGDLPPRERPRLNLYVTPGWRCGNAVSAEISWRYNAAAAALYDSDDAGDRARAVQACTLVSDFLNGENVSPCRSVFRRALSDPDPLVRELAAKAHGCPGS